MKTANWERKVAEETSNLLALVPLVAVTVCSAVAFMFGVVLGVALGRFG